MVCGLAYSVLAAPLAPGAFRGVGGLLTGFVCWLPFYMVGWLGAGDVKMFAAAGAWLGPLQALEGALIAAVAGAVLALVWMIGTSGAKRVATTLAMAAAQPSLLAPAAVRTTHRNTLPYGVALAFGALVAGWLPGLLF